MTKIRFSLLRCFSALRAGTGTGILVSRGNYWIPSFLIGALYFRHNRKAGGAGV